MQRSSIFPKLIIFLFVLTAAAAPLLSPPANAGTLINGGHVSEEITFMGEIDTFTFTANPGDHVEIRMVDTTTDGNLVPRIELYGPSGGDFLKYAQNYTVSSIEYTILEGGTYTILAKDANSSSLGEIGIGSYELHYVNVPGPNTGQKETIYKVLTNSAAYTAQADYVTHIYGCMGENTIILQLGADAKLMNVLGSNTITIESRSDLFSVSRSGATVIFQGPNGTNLSIPATTTAQSIVFNDKELDLMINSGNVKLGNQAINTTSSSIL
ncbi:MAG: hypothetical protein GY737_25005 [Desulfobacteraceae bacterium]|nr:hypothetical protein [Desulfobacteraceae bacterium]